MDELSPEQVLAFIEGDVHLFAGHRSMPAACHGCPFSAAAGGADYLAPGRLDGIKVAALLGQPFHCHKSVYSGRVAFDEDPETGDAVPPMWSKEYRQCGGALAWAKEFCTEHGRSFRVVGGPE